MGMTERERMGYLELENSRELWHFLIGAVPLGARMLCNYSGE